MKQPAHEIRATDYQNSRDYVLYTDENSNNGITLTIVSNRRKIATLPMSAVTARDLAQAILNRLR
jgi:hypothetical protein